MISGSWKTEGVTMEYSQLTLDDRINTYVGLQQNFTYQKIAKQLGKDESTREDIDISEWLGEKGSIKLKSI
jgi:hypothetical protein